MSTFIPFINTYKHFTFIILLDFFFGYLLFSISKLYISAFNNKDYTKDQISLNKYHLSISILIIFILSITTIKKYCLCTTTIQSLILFCCLIVCSLIDLAIKIVPNTIIIYALMARFLFLFFNKEIVDISFFTSLYIFIFINIFVFVCEKIKQKELMGGGDIKLLFVISLYFPYTSYLLGIFFSCLFGIFFGLLYKLTSKYQNGFPFVPSILLGYLIVFVFNSELLSLYLKFFQ